MINEKALKKAACFRVEPYIQESMVQLGIDVVVMIIVIAVLVATAFPLSVCVLVAAGYMALGLVFHYQVLIKALIDKHKGDFKVETVSIVCWKEDNSFFAGDALGHSHVRSFYPKEQCVGKYKIKAMNDGGEKLSLRTVASAGQMLEFAVLDKQQVDVFQVTYLKRSKIIVWVDLIGETNLNASKKNRNIIGKAIRRINTAI